MKLVELSNLLNNTIISFIYAQIPTKKRQSYAIDITFKKSRTYRHVKG